MYDCLEWRYHWIIRFKETVTAYQFVKIDRKRSGYLKASKQSSFCCDAVTMATHRPPSYYGFKMRNLTWPRNFKDSMAVVSERNSRNKTRCPRFRMLSYSSVFLMHVIQIQTQIHNKIVLRVSRAVSVVLKVFTGLFGRGLRFTDQPKVSTAPLTAILSGCLLYTSRCV